MRPDASESLSLDVAGDMRALAAIGKALLIGGE